MYICHKVEPGSQSFLMLYIVWCFGCFILYIVWCFGLPGTERKTPPSAPEADLIRSIGADTVGALELEHPRKILSTHVCQTASRLH